MMPVQSVHEIGMVPEAPHFLGTRYASPISFGRSFYGKTTGTRKAMRRAAKRRRINARLPK